jgi:hypothetical protein
MCRDRNSNRVPSQYESKALPLHQPVWYIWHKYSDLSPEDGSSMSLRNYITVSSQELSMCVFIWFLRGTCTADIIGAGFITAELTYCSNEALRQNVSGWRLFCPTFLSCIEKALWFVDSPHPRILGFSASVPGKQISPSLSGPSSHT